MMLFETVDLNNTLKPQANRTTASEPAMVCAFCGGDLMQEHPCVQQPKKLLLPTSLCLEPEQPTEHPNPSLIPEICTFNPTT